MTNEEKLDRDIQLLRQEFNAHKQDVANISKQVSQIKNIVIGIAIGGGIVALIFGIISLREVKEVIDVIK